MPQLSRGLINRCLLYLIFNSPFSQKSPWYFPAQLHFLLSSWHTPPFWQGLDEQNSFSSQNFPVNPSWHRHFLITLLYIRYGKLYLHKQKIFSHHSISFKNLLSLSAKFDSYLFTTFTIFITASLNFLCTEQYKWFTFSANSWGSLIKPTFYV